MNSGGSRQAKTTKIQAYLQKKQARREVENVKAQVKAGVKKVEADVAAAKAS